jgi:predicted class III extradiol MEMO1 family dioxygenase
MCGRRLIDKSFFTLMQHYRIRIISSCCAPPLGYRLCGRIAMWRWLTFVFVEPIRWLDVLF